MRFRRALPSLSWSNRTAPGSHRIIGFLCDRRMDSGLLGQLTLVERGNLHSLMASLGVSGNVTGKCEYTSEFVPDDYFRLSLVLICAESSVWEGSAAVRAWRSCEGHRRCKSFRGRGSAGPTAGNQQGQTHRGRSGSVSREETQKVREWAMANGYNHSSRGRISQHSKWAYDDSRT